MGWNQPKESDQVINAEKVQGQRTNATGNAKWDNLPEVNRVGAKFQNKDAVNTANGTGKSGNPGKPV